MLKSTIENFRCPLETASVLQVGTGNTVWETLNWEIYAQSNNPGSFLYFV
jgi:hypothetical protein